MPRQKFTKPDEVVLIYNDPDDKDNHIALRFFADDIPVWLTEIDVPVRDMQLIEERTKGKNFKTILEDIPTEGGM